MKEVKNSRGLIRSGLLLCAALCLASTGAAQHAPKTTLDTPANTPANTTPANTSANSPTRPPWLAEGDEEIILMHKDPNEVDTRAPEERCHEQADAAAFSVKGMNEPYGTSQATRIGHRVGASISRKMTRKREYKNCMAKANAVTPGKAAEMKPLQHFADCAACPEMIVLPKGEFLFGYSVPEREIMNKIFNRKIQLPPQKLIKIDYVMAVGKYEVTMWQYRQCVNDNVCTPPAANTMSMHDIFIKNIYESHTRFQTQFYDDLPATDLDNNQILQYVAWLSKKTGRKYKLPSEIEWQYAARAGVNQAYPWGNEPGKNMAMISEYGHPGKFYDENRYRVNVSVTTVGQFKPNAWGLYDVIGNASEIILDCSSGKSLDSGGLSKLPSQYPNNCGRILSGVRSGPHVLAGGNARTSSFGSVSEGFRIFVDIQ